MSDDRSDQSLVESWKHGDQPSADVLFRRYHARLLGLVRSRLSRKLARRVDPEDIVLSAYRSFFLAARKSDVTIPSTDNLWQLLTTVTLRKLSHQARRHFAMRRSIDREQHDESHTHLAEPTQESTAEHAVLIADQVEAILTQLDPKTREVFVLTLQGQDPETIAQKLDCHERSVRRALQKIRSTFPEQSVDLSLSAVFGDQGEKLSADIQPVQIKGTARYDDYVLQQLAGVGAFSKVYRAIERPTGQTVAVKYLRKDCWYDTRTTTSLIREYELLKQLNHPHVLTIHGWGTTRRGALFLASEFIEGMNLEKWSKCHPLDYRSIARIVRQVAEGIFAAHSRGILHGDIKPANVLMGHDGRVVLCDFGFARYASDPEDVPRGGTAGFLAPEQISDEYGPMTGRTDVYGIGCLLYALLTGRPPMLGRDLPETLARILSSECAASPSAIASNSCTELDQLVLHCLAKEPADRPTHIEQVIESLKLIEASENPRDGEPLR